jgi:ribonuclease VapC
VIVDTSALLAVLQAEAGASDIADALARGEARIAAPTLVEARVVMGARFGPTGVRRLDALLRACDVQVVAFDERMAAVASDAYRDFGRGSGHPAGLNLGDTFSYALAAILDEPLLFVGADFIHTDLAPAL